jgi:hypothetical protein
MSMQASSVIIDGVHFYGESRHPIIPRTRMAWQRSDAELEQVWASAPSQSLLSAPSSSLLPPIDVLLTHCPPRGILDRIIVGTRVGDPALRDAVLQRLRPQFHCFGHIHEAYGVVVRSWLGAGQATTTTTTTTTTTFINAASVSVTRKAGVDRAVVFDVRPRGAASQQQ